jgi:hypothetical protein
MIQGGIKDENLILDQVSMLLDHLARSYGFLVWVIGSGWGVTQYNSQLRRMGQKGG